MSTSATQGGHKKAVVVYSICHMKFITFWSKITHERQQGRLPVRHLNDEVFPACNDQFNVVLKLLDVHVKSTDARSCSDYKLFQRHEILLHSVNATLTSMNGRLHALQHIHHSSIT